jgi:hypothetical protein
VIKRVINEIVATGWTIFGLAIAWAVLPDGATRDIVGSVLAGMTLVWVLTMPLRIAGE